MILEQRPQFDDVNAKTKVRNHNTFQGKVIEILYGAKDENGQSVAPREGVNDGHGRWFGIETNGVYQMFVWQKPASEGGEIEYGTEYKEDALKVMEETLLKKLELCREAEEISKNGESEEDEARLLAIGQELEGMEDWHTPKDAEYTKRYGIAKERFEGRIGGVKENKALKEEVLEKATALLEVTNFKNAKQSLKNLRNNLRNISSAGNKADDEIWKKFNEIEKTIKENESNYFENLDTIRAQAKETKEKLIEELGKAVSKVTNWKVATNEVNRLFDEWKKAGSAGKLVDDELWEKFNTARQKFFEDRKEFFEEREAQFKESIAKKEELIAKAKEYVESNDLGRSVTDKMKDLDKKWREAGFSGKELNDKLWDEFNKVKDVFWQAKKDAVNKTFLEQIAAKEEELNKATKQLEDLKYRLSLDVKPVLKEDLERNIYIKEEQVKDLTAQIENLKNRLQ